MLTQAHLIIWAVTGALTAALEVTISARYRAGKLGEQARARYARAGELSDQALGSPAYATIIITAAVIIFDLAAWPAGLAVCLYHWHHDLRAHQAELARATRPTQTD
jgi:hypothetical protein